jgi:hypothetical protein
MTAKLTTALSAASIRWRHHLAAALACALLAVHPVTVPAQPDAAKRIRDELALVQQEQQAVFQQFQMIRELRDGLAAPSAPPPALTVYGSGQTLPNYDDQVAAQKERDQKLADYSREMERLYARYQELDGQRKELVEELGKVGASR